MGAICRGRLRQRIEAMNHLNALFTAGTLTARRFEEMSVRIDSFVADAPAGWEPTLSDEHDERRWCTYAEALELLTWPEARAALTAADRAGG